MGVDWRYLQGTGRTGRIIERDVRAAVLQAPAGQDVRISPLGRRLAEEMGVDIQRLAAAHPGKRLTRDDVEQAAGAIEANAVPEQPVRPAAEPARTPDERREPISHVRRVIAQRMAASAHTAAPVTLTTEADATELVRIRQQLKGDARSGQVVPAYNDILAKLAAQALMEHPGINARLESDSIVYAPTAHIGLAVDTERGLLVPVLRDVQTKGLQQLARESAELVERARAGKLGTGELTGSTFTITNLGMYDIDAFTPIINLPECAILGVGRIVAKQVVVDAAAERLAIRHMVFLSLTFDHRLVDGAPAARFLQRIKQYVEQPYLWLAI
jgi:pyruvate dehydrogenase E2 component (dihydrolipoamide acetyltransferase)